MPTVVITDLAVIRPDPQTHELMLMAVHPGVEPAEVVERTGWDLQKSTEFVVSEPPTVAELRILRDLKART